MKLACSYSPFVRVLLGLLALSAMNSLAVAQDVPKLRYDWKPGTAFAYEISITADRPDETDEMKGIVVFTAKANGDEQVEVGFAGNLARKETPKPGAKTSDPRRPGGPPSRLPGPDRFGPRGPLGSSSPATGLTWQTNDVRLEKTGTFVAIKGSSQLPYLLGHLALLPFENFPAEAKKAWGVEFGALITESSGNSRRVPRFLSENEPKKKTSAGGETIQYAIEKQDGSRVTVRRTSELLMVPQENKDPKFQLQFEGTFEFDAERGLTTTSESKGKFVVELSNVTINVPMTVKMRLLSDDERKQFEEKKKSENDDRVAKLKQQQEDEAAKLKRPLTDDERQEIVKALKSGNTTQQMPTLMMLAKRTPTDDDKEIAAAIKPLLDSNFPVIRNVATGTWKTWSKLLPEDGSAKPEAAKTETPKPNDARSKAAERAKNRKKN